MLFIIEDGKSIDTSMGFTPNAGIMMGTRSGDIDYSILSYIMKKEERNLNKIDERNYMLKALNKYLDKYTNINNDIFEENYGFKKSCN